MSEKTPHEILGDQRVGVGSDFSIDVEWFKRKAAEEGDLEIGAGYSVLVPPAYDNCACPCHRGSGIIHVVACCHPTTTSEKQRLIALAKLMAKHPKQDRKPK